MISPYLTSGYDYGVGGMYQQEEDAYHDYGRELDPGNFWQGVAELENKPDAYDTLPEAIVVGNSGTVAATGGYDPESPFGGQQVKPKEYYGKTGTSAPQLDYSWQTPKAVEPDAAKPEDGGFEIFGWSPPDMSLDFGGSMPGLTLPGLGDFSGGLPGVPDVTAPFDAALDFGKMMPMMMMMMMMRD